MTSFYWSGVLTEEQHGDAATNAHLKSLAAVSGSTFYFALSSSVTHPKTEACSRVWVMYRCVEHTCGFFTQAAHTCHSNHLVCISSSLDVWKCLRHSSAALRYKTHSHVSQLSSLFCFISCVIHSFSPLPLSLF